MRSRIYMTELFQQSSRERATSLVPPAHRARFLPSPTSLPSLPAPQLASILPPTSQPYSSDPTTSTTALRSSKSLSSSPDSNDDPTKRQNLNLILTLCYLVQIRRLELGLRLRKNLHSVLDEIPMKSLEGVELRNPVSRRGRGRRGGGGGRRSSWEFLESEGFAVPASQRGVGYCEK